MGGQESETVFETRCVGGHIIDNANGGLQLRADTLAGTPRRRRTKKRQPDSSSGRCRPSLCGCT